MDTPFCWDCFDTPFGRLLATADEAGNLLGLRTAEGADTGTLGRHVPALLAEVGRQLTAYCGGELRDFDLPLLLHGSPFQLAAWRALQAIPYGETLSYGEQARALGQPGAARAVGLANNRNPIMLIVPCHRVIGSNGALVGFGGGLPLKQALLAFEQAKSGRGNLPLF
ncbi:methylated-DNA--[protein]-cysteine S-methyltransferase [Chitinimonas sp.]|uniref:methylated-DNA--[protein]-cysteine S-methyltransferase n=1 Tax=Chitinimonas sp. TaxID=1934313 RepID=UPI002F959C63